MTAHLDRARVLIAQSRHDLADEELRRELTENPQNPVAHALLALCLSQQKRYKEATAEAQSAIQLAPDEPLSHYALAGVLNDRDRLPEAEAAIREAIRLDPYDADYFALLANLRFQQRDWAGALDAADKGLELDAEHVVCTNLRVMALPRLGRKDEAGAVIQAALAKDPENPLSHANQGWTLLRQNNYQKALEHFREALRLDPGFDYARHGIVEALKARHFIYRLLLQYFFWMSNLSRNAQWVVIIGAFFGHRFVRSIATTHPDLAPFLYPVLYLYSAFALMTWLGDPLFNLLLRFSRFGRLALTDEQRTASTWIAACVFLAVGSLLAAVLTGFDPLYFSTIGFGLLVVPLSAIFRCETGWPRKAMIVYTAVLVLSAVSGFILLTLTAAETGSRDPSDLRLAAIAAMAVFLFGAIFAGFVANALQMVRPRR